MLRKKLIPLLMILALSWIFSGCAERVVYQIPPLKERAIPDLQLDERPSLNLSDEEVVLLQKTSPVITGKIMKFILAVEGYEDIADVVVKGYRSFILKVFSEEKRE